MTPSAHIAGGRRVTRWTRETIIEKVVEWNDRYGEPPCSADWNPSLARWRAQEWRAERYREGIWPSTNAAKRPFGGSFDEAVRAAGLVPARPGPRRRAPLLARPDVEQRAPAAPRIIEDELASAAARAARAEARAAGLERRLAAAERRAEKAQGALDGARRRARSAVDQAGRARRARDRGREEDERARGALVEEVARAIEDADVRVRAAEDQAGAALRDAAQDRARAREAESRALVPAGGAERRVLGVEEVERLRAGGPSGPAVLAAALRSLASARATGDRHGLARALGEVASAAVRWRDRL